MTLVQPKTASRVSQKFAEEVIVFVRVLVIVIGPVERQFGSDYEYEHRFR